MNAKNNLAIFKNKNKTKRGKLESGNVYNMHTSFWNIQIITKKQKKKKGKKKEEGKGNTDN